MVAGQLELVGEVEAGRGKERMSKLKRVREREAIDAYQAL
jgi:hypothetical protein